MSERDIWFLDLEETIITDFTDPEIANLEVVKEHFKRIGVKQVHIFSFAIWGSREKKIFEQPNFKGWLERVFELEIVTYPSMQEVMDEVFWKTHTKWELTDFISIWGKARAFADYCLMMHHTKNCFLIDDIVPNAITVDRKTGLTTEFINVLNLHEWERFKHESLADVEATRTSAK
jgi:hypothetical protein